MSTTVLKFNGEPMTRREIEIAREAYKNGAAAERGHAHDDSGWKPEAERRYPLPKVPRPRIVRDPAGGMTGTTEWSIIDGSMCMRGKTYGPWLRWRDYREWSDSAPLPERVKMWADLWANPTEEVEDGA